LASSQVRTTRAVWGVTYFSGKIWQAW